MFSKNTIETIFELSTALSAILLVAIVFAAISASCTISYNLACIDELSAKSPFTIVPFTIFAAMLTELLAKSAVTIVPFAICLLKIAFEATLVAIYCVICYVTRSNCICSDIC